MGDFLVVDYSTLEKDYEKYLALHRRIEMIDSAITNSMGNHYFLKDNCVEIHTDINCKEDIKKAFETDLVYVSESLREVLMVEETTDPTNKLQQMKSYQYVSSQSLKMITGADVTPCLDVMFVFPIKFREEAIEIFDSMEKKSNMGKGLGISLWCYSDKQDSIKCIGGSISERFPYRSQVMPTTGIGTFKILKNPDRLFLLKFIVLRALENQYGDASEEGIEFDREKLLKWLKPCGLVSEARWRTALQLGSDVGWIEQYSSDQLTGIIKHTKPSPKSINQSKQMMIDFKKATSDGVIIDDRQKKLSDFLLESEPSDNNEED